MLILTRYFDQVEIFPVETFYDFIQNIFNPDVMTDKIYVIKSEITYEEDVLIYFSFHSYLRTMSLMTQERILGRNGNSDIILEFSNYYLKQSSSFTRTEYIFDNRTNILVCTRLINFCSNDDNSSATFAKLDTLSKYNISYNDISEPQFDYFDINFFKFDLHDQKKIIENKLVGSKKRKRID